MISDFSILTQRDPPGRNPHDRTPCSHQDLLLQQARRINALQLLSGVLLPTVFPFDDLPFGIREIALREFAVHANTVLMQNNTPTSDGQRVNALLYRRFSLSGNQRLWCRASLATQNPDCTPPVLHSLWRPHSTTSPLRSCDRGSRDRDFTGCKFLALQNPESRFSDATCQHLPLNREIATRDSNEHETLASSNAEARYADIRWPAPSCA
jgi:hypothetical protein